jgi:hypothetical protein
MPLACPPIKPAMAFSQSLRSPGWAAVDCHTMLSGANARRSRESRTGRSNSIVFGYKVRGGRLTCARHPWDMFKVTRCCRVVGGLGVLFSFGYGSNYLRR